MSVWLRLFSNITHKRRTNSTLCAPTLSHFVFGDQPEIKCFTVFLWLAGHRIGQVLHNFSEKIPKNQLRVNKLLTNQKRIERKKTIEKLEITIWDRVVYSTFDDSCWCPSKRVVILRPRSRQRRPAEDTLSTRQR